MPAEPIPEPVTSAGEWSALYLRARALEGRLATDAVVARLPDVPADHPLAREWRQRADSADRLVRYVRARSPAGVVDLGCGNGWLANRLAAIDGTEVVGVDVNAVEIDQARRVFGARAHLRFVRADILDGPLPIERPDLVVLASVLQYVPEPARLVGALLAQLGPQGEVHIVDSPIYGAGAVQAASERTRRHYDELGVPEMADHYYHHAWDEISPVPFEVVYRPDDRRPRVERRLLRRPRSPFPWIRIRVGAGR